MPVHKSPGARTRAVLAALSWCALLAGGAALPAGATAQVEADTNRIFDPVELFWLHCWDPLRLDGGFLGSDHPNELARVGAATPEGWDQRCWTVLADVNNRHWRIGRSSRDFREPLCLVPTSDSFFGHSQYINVRLLMHTEGDPLTIIQTSRTIRQASYEALYAGHSD